MSATSRQDTTVGGAPARAGGPAGPGPSGAAGASERGAVWAVLHRLMRWETLLVLLLAGVALLNVRLSPYFWDLDNILDDTSTFMEIGLLNTLIQQHVNAIAISADDPGVPVPALKKAMARGIKVVSYDSDVQPAGRQIFCNQANTEQIGRIEVRILGRELGYKGDVAILSAASTAPNQNIWIGFMKQELALPKYKNMRLVTTVYGNDDAATSTTQAQGLLTKYRNLRGIISPTTVGIKAAAQVVKVAGKSGKVIVTGLGTPNDMRSYVLDGTVPDFALWNPGDLGYLAEYTAHELAGGMLKPDTGSMYKAGKLGSYKVGAGGVVLLGPPFEFTKANIGKFNF